MEKINLNEYLASNEYPGRGIAVAMAPDGRQMFIGYFIMGRSENSRNRVFDPIPERGGICTVAADPDKLEDPSLIIYNPVLTLGKTQIVTNGDQTDTIFDEMSRGRSFAGSAAMVQMPPRSGMGSNTRLRLFSLRPMMKYPRNIWRPSGAFATAMPRPGYSLEARYSFRSIFSIIM